MRTYIDGSVNSSASSDTAVGPTQGIPQRLNVGAYIWNPTGSRWFFQGVLDEVRISKDDRSAAWIETELMPAAGGGFAVGGDVLEAMLCDGELVDLDRP